MLNSVVIAGRMVRDPELRRTGSGKAVASFTLAVDRDFKNQQTGEKEVDFFDCVAWGAAGENAARYFSKGQMAMVTGRLQIRSWTDKNGQNRKQTEILVSSLYFCGGKDSSAQTGSGGGVTPKWPVQVIQHEPMFTPVEAEDDQLPY